MKWPRPLYPQGKSPWYELDTRLGGPQSWTGHGGEAKNSQPLPGLEPPIILTFYFYNTRFNIISHQRLEYMDVSHLPSNLPWCDHPNNILWIVKIKKFLCNCLHPLVTYRLLGPNISPSSLLWNTFELYRSHRVRDQIS
jgi:hypothetical protein